MKKKVKMINKLLTQLAKLEDVCKQRDLARRKCEELVGEIGEMNQLINKLKEEKDFYKQGWEKMRDEVQHMVVSIEKLKQENKALMGCSVKPSLPTPLTTTINGYYFHITNGLTFIKALEEYTKHITDENNARYLKALRSAINSIEEI